jgi:hypothetical protein
MASDRKNSTSRPFSSVAGLTASPIAPRGVGTRSRSGEAEAHLVSGRDLAAVVFVPDEDVEDGEVVEVRADLADRRFDRVPRLGVKAAI